MTKRKRQTVVYKTVHRKLIIEQHKLHKKVWMNSVHWWGLWVHFMSCFESCSLTRCTWYKIMRQSLPVTCGRSVVISTNQTDHHDLTEILLKVTLNTIISCLAFIIDGNLWFPIVTNHVNFDLPITIQIGCNHHCIFNASMLYISTDMEHRNKQ